MSLDMGVDWTRVVFGEKARHVACQLTITRQNGRTPDGKPVYMVAGVVVGEIAHPEIDSCGMQLIVGDMIVRPRIEMTGPDHVGEGAQGMLTSDALFTDGWSKQLT